MKKLLSVIVPSYNEEEMVHETAIVISNILQSHNIPFEILFVNDGSKDNTWECIDQESKVNPCIRGVSFSRNFGKEAAIFAGLANAGGDCCVLIDCDLQHPPQKIVEMYRLWEKGYEIVEGVKLNRGKENIFYTFAAKSFYKFISNAIKIDMTRASDFKLLDRKAVDTLLDMNEKKVFFRALSSWIGFKTTTIGYEVQERTAGFSKWSAKSLFRYALSNISSFSAAPLQIVTVLGVIMLFVSIVMGVIALTQKIAGIALGGFTTVIILQLFTGSIIMISLGIIGFYIAQIYEEVKGRQRYIISEYCGGTESDRKTFG